MVITSLLLVVGLLLLFAGGESLVRGASQLAYAAKLSPLFVGLTIVAFGTSTPELVVSISTALQGEADLSLGNVVGSNIFNILFILGLSAVVAPLTVKRQIVRWDVPLMIAISVVLLILAQDGRLTALEGWALLAGMLTYTAFSYWQGSRDRDAVAVPADDVPAASGRKGMFFQLGLILFGLVLLVAGCELFVRSAISIAQALGVSTTIIGLTIVAAGTSLPELATSVIASYRNERDIAVGNVVGSNIFNILGVLGSACIFSGTGVGVPESFLQFDLPIMVGTAIVCLPIFFTGRVIARWEGAVFLVLYVAYTTYLILATTNSGYRDHFGTAMIAFVLPLITLGIIVSLIRHPWKRTNSESVQSETR
ncbi:calcium/sodium antiporter [Rubinisphaera margarita]|uniref:calcium/sodium antiporter n=1 Tax=Rubinisphaera margarita TaxID=2909586 RepID=UPI001EE99795|nr:calcium/sodium antiporter [Rubinisphaera margarita]MCG6154615.1 calcium/sodium antiporter [Rubinisphaera margarita]